MKKFLHICRACVHGCPALLLIVLITPSPMHYWLWIPCYIVAFLAWTGQIFGTDEHNA